MAPSPFRLAPRYSTTIDFTAVLQQAGVDAEQQQRVKKAQSLLRSLPEGSSDAVKRQVVEAAFHAFDVPTQKIVEAATRQVVALEAFIQSGNTSTQQGLDEGAARIAELENEIDEIRASMAASVADQEVRDASTQQQIAAVQPILAFFAQRPEPVVQQQQQQHQQQHQDFFGRPPPVPTSNDFFGRPPPPASDSSDFFAPPKYSSELPDVITDVDFE